MILDLLGDSIFIYLRNNINYLGIAQNHFPSLIMVSWLSLANIFFSGSGPNEFPTKSIMII